jgi:hypothetical protein
MDLPYRFLAGGATMFASEEAPFAFAVERLQRAAARPIRWGEHGWPAQMGLALAGLRKALDRHAVQTEAPSGLFAAAADPEALPFLPDAAQVARLRQQHREFRRRLDALTSGLAFVEGLGGEPGFRVLFEVARGAEQLASEAAEHLSRETELERTTRQPPARAARVPDRNRSGRRR